LEVSKGPPRHAAQAPGISPTSGGGAMTSLKMHYYHTILIKMTHYGPKRDEFVQDKIRVDIFRVNAWDKLQIYDFRATF